MVTVTIPRRFLKDRVVEVVLPGRPGLSSKELTQWMAYEKVNGPLDDRRGDVQAAQLVSALGHAAELIAKASGAKVKGEHPPLSELALDWDTDRPPVDLDKLLANARAANMLAGGVES